MTKESGLALLQKYGREYFRQLRMKVKRESLVEAGRKGGKQFIKKYGKQRLKAISKIGRKSFQKRIHDDRQLKKKFRELFIERMKNFTRIHPLKNGLKVRSKLEQEIANYLLTKGINFSYEAIILPTKYGDYQPDFIIGNKLLIEILGMDTTFYLKKKLPKLEEAAKNNPQFQWIIFTPPNISIDLNLNNCRITSNKKRLLNFIKEAS